MALWPHPLEKRSNSGSTRSTGRQFGAKGTLPAQDPADHTPKRRRKRMPNDIAPAAAAWRAAPSELAAEIRRRRTFAIISHPDAGKTTLTEKLLLFGGAIQLAGQVKAKKDGRNTRSDWMAIEKARGISVVTSVMTFEYDGAVFNLLDTPGHEDFSDHTYRTLTAVDSRHHGHRRGEGHRGAHAQAVRSLPAARHPDHHLHQQARPRGARAARAARRDREGAGARHRADGLADRQGTRLPRHLRSRQPAHPPHRRGRRRACRSRGRTTRCSKRCSSPTSWPRWREEIALVARRLRAAST